MATDTLPADTLQKMAKSANFIYWDLHALLFSAELILKEMDEDDNAELRSLIGMAGVKALEMIKCFDPYVQSKPEAKPA